MSTKKEVERLIQYTKSLGIKVKMMEYVHFSNTMAEWAVDENDEVTIYLYQKNKQNSTELALDLLHELAHHRSWVKSGRKLKRKVIKVLDKPDDELTADDKRLIYREEKRDSGYQLEIARELGLKIPEGKIKVSIDQVNWIYEFCWKNDRYPTIKERKAHIKELRKRHES